jgi:outer membrane autotransporter protein
MSRKTGGQVINFIHFLAHSLQCKSHTSLFFNVKRLKLKVSQIVYRVILVNLLSAIFFMGLSKADTFNEVVSAHLAGNCALLIQPDISNGDPEILKIGPNLAGVCGFSCVSNGVGGISCVLGAGTDGSTGGSASQYSVDTSAIRRLQALRENDEDSNGQSGDIRSGEGDANNVISITPDFNIFASIGYESREKELTAFEDGYDSDISRIMLGGDYRLDDKTVIGLAFNYSTVSGTFQDGGDFNTDTYEGILFGSLAPLENMYIEVALSYSDLKFDKTRQTSFSRTVGVGEGVPVLTFGGPVSADFSGSKTSLYAAFGYDYVIGKINIGPRAGINWVTVETNSYQETGGTGLELSVMEDTKESLQGTLGVQASQTVNTNFGVLVPQINLSWIHEFKDDQRDINARFAEDGRISPVVFSYATEDSDKDYGEASVSLSAMLPNNVAAFTNIWTYFGHDQFDAYGVSTGFRVEF